MKLFNLNTYNNEEVFIYDCLLDGNVIELLVC